MFFEIVGDIKQVKTFATGTAIREVERLRKQYGKGRCRKRKGIAQVKLADDTSVMAELHWYEATGIGRKECKIKRFLEEI